MLMIYIHGWKHTEKNEHSDDSDWSAFKNALKRAQVSLHARASEGEKALVPVGVFFRWPARHVAGPLENLFYWATRNRANRIIERGEIAGALTKIVSKVVRNNPESEVALIGHSMGARILGRSLLISPELVTLPNLIVLLNAADDTHSAQKIEWQLEQSARNEGSSNVSLPRLVWLTARTDLATRLVFLLAEFKVAVGHSRKLRTHKVKRVNSPERLAFTFNSKRWGIIPEGGGTQFWWNVWVPLGVILGHSDPEERFKQIIQSIYHLIYDRPQVEHYFDIMINGPGGTREIAKYQIEYQYDNHEKKADIAREYLNSKSLDIRQRNDCEWILKRATANRDSRRK